MVVSGVASSPLEVASYARCTLLAASLAHERSTVADDVGAEDSGSEQEANIGAVHACIQFLKENEFITLRSTEGQGNICYLAD